MNYEKKSNFNIEKSFRALQMIVWSFSSHHIEKRLNTDYTLPYLLRLKLALKFK